MNIFDTSLWLEYCAGTKAGKNRRLSVGDAGAAHERRASMPGLFHPF
jgi:hypothetical protein